MSTDTFARHPTMRDVAGLAGVSLQTVSNAFAHPERVAEETWRRVRVAAASIGFAPNRAASSLRQAPTSWTAFVGIGVPRISVPYIAALVQTVDESLWRHGILLQIVDGANVGVQHEAFRTLPQHGAAALIEVTSERPIGLHWRDDTPVPVLRFGLPQNADQIGPDASEGTVIGTRMAADVADRLRLTPRSPSG